MPRSTVRSYKRKHGVVYTEECHRGIGKPISNIVFDWQLKKMDLPK